jgi:hypothetical protein
MTPCSLINSERISTPGSTTRPSHSSHRRVQAPVRTISISKELNEFFGAEERRQQQAFIDKYGPLTRTPAYKLHNLLCCFLIH